MKKTPSYKQYLLIPLAAGLMALTPAYADTLYDTTPPNTPRTDIPGIGTLGYAFTLANTVTLDQLGFYDKEKNGLTDSHFVGLWAYDGTGNLDNATSYTLLASGIVPAGAGTTDANGFIYTDPTFGAGITLTPGVTYVLGATINNSTDDVYVLTAGLTSTQVSDDVTVMWAGYYAGTADRVPTGGRFATGGNGRAYLGPNLTFTAVPEPATCALTAGGLGLLALCRRRFRKNA